MTAIAAVSVAASASDWPHWRGPQRNDTTAESSGWEQGEWRLNEVWRVRVGEGSSSPIVAGDRVYLTGWSDGRDTVSCRETATGNVLWEQSSPSPQYGRLARGDEGLYSGPCSTPEFDAETGRLYTLGIDGDLNCWDTRDGGKNVWKKSLYDEYRAPVRPKVGRSGHRDYGYTSSPLLQGSQLIVEVGAPAGNLIAFDKNTGAEVWASRDGSSAGHTGGPVPLAVEGVPCVAVHNFEGLLVVRIDPGHAGETVATVPWKTDFANNVATPAVFENNVVMTSSYNHHKLARFRISLAGGAEKVWEVGEASKVCSPVIAGGHVYWAWHEMTCVDFETGSVRWRGGTYGEPGSVIVTGDRKLIAWANNGDLSLSEMADASPAAYVELASRRRVGEADAWPHVVLADGRLICKDRSGLVVCLQLDRGIR